MSKYPDLETYPYRIFADYYTDREFVPLEDKDAPSWPMKFFEPTELVSKGNGSFRADWQAMYLLDRCRFLLNEPMIVTSAYRDVAYNQKVGGAKRSKHLLGKAFDIKCKAGRHRRHLLICAATVGFKGFGFYRSFLHMDTGPSRMWEET